MVYVRDISRQTMRLHHKRSCWDRQIKFDFSPESILVSLCTHLDLRLIYSMLRCNAGGSCRQTMQSPALFGLKANGLWCWGWCL